MKKGVVSLLALIFCMVTVLPLAYAKTQFVTIGTGGLTGVYYPTGGAIAKMVNNKKREYGIRATVESTGGSAFNINAIMSGDLEFGIAQSDKQFQAMKGLAEWAERGPQADLRSVFSIHDEAVTLISAVESQIKDASDLKGKIVNLGNPGSGQLENAIEILETLGIDPEKDVTAEYIKASEAPSILQDGRIDAFFYTVGHPNGAITEATSGARKVRFTSITGVDSMLKKYPYFSKTIIRASMYPGAQNDADTETIGMKATLVTSAKVPEDVVYAITKEVFENFEEFKKLHPAYATLTREGMLTGLPAPLHAGAEKYYKEVGLMK
ncbi:TAXI family TRAP transporter solute-binding subunit [Desulfobacter postgatei]|uniref:TRAP transporter solute receptor, TAXI family n=1 Tax=Desulfobacter postgatei 2ac9 TaxID=879212 RepID=I5B0K6_9BACT|nr:TAXI family TRAP transporter solute-binding subunit [Desulfobacter postgatei]EIM63019.1 TRAP transporter solute receptor, TAXI family [Desulfobacter postgatei 2ac9]